MVNPTHPLLCRVRGRIHLFNVQGILKFSSFELHFQEGITLLNLHWGMINPPVGIHVIDKIETTINVSLVMP
jgi:hypothetical protein